jgi:hypothetical protein
MQAPASEVIIEGYYKVTLSKRVAQVQDLQYRHQPREFEANEPVATSRLVVSF